MWLTVLHTIPEENMNKLLEYCEKARKADRTFKYKHKADRVTIESPEYNQAYRRGMLFHHNFNCYFEVIKKEE